MRSLLSRPPHPFANFPINATFSNKLRRSSLKAAEIPYECLQRSAEYELRFYNPRYVLEMSYEKRDKAYMTFDQYLTGGLCVTAPKKFSVTKSASTNVSVDGSPAYVPTSMRGSLHNLLMSYTCVIDIFTGANESALRMESPAPVLMCHAPARILHLS